jgi:hypothetical protein
MTDLKVKVKIKAPYALIYGSAPVLHPAGHQSLSYSMTSQI